MQYTAHKSLTAYIREQTWPRLILPVILMLVCSLIIIFGPVSQKHANPANSLTDVANTYPAETSSYTISTDELYYTGVALRSTLQNRAYVYYTFEGEKCYLVVLTAAPFRKPANTLAGVTINVTPTRNEEIYRSVCRALSGTLQFSEERLKEMISDVILDQYEYDNGFATFAFYGLHVFFVLSTAVAIYWLIQIIFPQCSICVRRMRRYGQAASLYALAVAEFDSAAPIGRRNLFVTDNFFIALLKHDIIIQPLDHITWLYQTHVVHHPHGQAKMFHTLCIVTDHKKIHKLPRLSEPVIASLINAIASACPGVKIGNAWKGKDE